MPSNQIVINNGIEYFVSDSKMPELIEYLDTNGELTADCTHEWPSKSLAEVKDL